jgi:hypothetical protein
MTAREDPIVWLAICRLFFPRDECFTDEGMDWYGLLGGLRFARSHKTVNDGTSHVHFSCGKIDVTPLQSEQLALSNAGRSCNEDQGSLANFQTF